MRRYENEVFQMHQPVIDLELKAYVKQKKQINEKIQNHWKLELNTHVIFKLNIFNIQTLYSLYISITYSHWIKNNQ
jgi:hypothetical protein